jgi:4-hydroxyacetophenone monooxygenase
MKTAVDEGFIRRALDAADLNAVRVALYHLTGDEELVTLTPVDTPENKPLLVAKAVDYLSKLTPDVTLPDVSDERLRRMMEMASGPMTDLEFEARRGLVALEEYPWSADWTDGKPQLPEGFHVAIIGAGFSGVACGAQLARLGIPFTIFERRDEVGGVWSTNKYPDARVDTASTTTSTTSRRTTPGPNTSPGSPKYRATSSTWRRSTAVWPNLRLNSPLKAARFDEQRSIWTLTIGQLDGTSYEFEANAIVSAVGVFANPLFVDFAGSEDFGGQIVHPTQWGSGNYDVTGKSVAVIGNGSTGVQLVSPVAEAAKQLYVFQRTAQWISPRPRYGQPVEPEVRWLLDTMPGYWNWQRYLSTAALFETHALMVMDPEWIAQGGLVSQKNDAIRDVLTAYIKGEVGDRPI